MHIGVTISEQHVYHQQYGNYSLKSQELGTDIADALTRALDAVQDGALKISVPVRNYGDQTGVLSLDMEP